MWVPPGKKANRNLWRYDMASRMMLPPGVEGSPKGTQVEMPESYLGSEPRGFHMVASPAGSQAPIHHINYTPETGEVHGRGIVAPMDKLNYTLMPEEALAGQQMVQHLPAPPGGMQPIPNAPLPTPGVDAMGQAQQDWAAAERQSLHNPPQREYMDSPANGFAGAGHGAGGGQGFSAAMGAGAAVPSLDAFGGNVQPFAGTPPLSGSPSLQGPSPTTNRAAPQWGGGGTPFDSRMGMGADVTPLPGLDKRGGLPAQADTTGLMSPMSATQPAPQMPTPTPLGPQTPATPTPQAFAPSTPTPRSSGVGWTPPSARFQGTAAPAPTFAGAPPTQSGSQTLTGPSPTLNRAMPQWGQGSSPFMQRMGMGQSEGEDVFRNADPSGSSSAPSAPPGTPPPTGPNPVLGSAQGNENVLINPLTNRPWQLSEAVPIYGADNRVIAYKIYDGDDVYTNPKFHYTSGDSATKVTTERRADGSIDVITVNPDGTVKVETRGTPDPALVAKAAADKALQDVNLQIARINLQIAQSKDPDVERQRAATELATAQTNLQKAQTDAAKADKELGLLGQPPKQALPSHIVGKDGMGYDRDPDTGVLTPTGIYEAGTGTWERSTHDGGVYLLNPQTHEEIFLQPQDTYKDYPPMKVGGGKWVQWDPARQGFKVVYQDDPEWDTQWAGDELLKVNKNNPSDVQSIWKKKPTRAEDDAHAAAIDAHNTALLAIEKTKQDLQLGKITAAQARIAMEDTIQKMLHPVPTQLNAGSFYVPQGLDVDIEDWDPATGKTSTRHVSGGPRDPRVSAAIDQATQFMKDFHLDTGGTPTPNASGGAAPGGTTGGDATQGGRQDLSTGKVGGADTLTNQGQGGTENVGVLPAGWAGVAGRDPRVSGTAQPPVKITTGTGTYLQDAMGNQTPLQSDTSGDQTLEGQDEEGGDWYFDAAGRRRSHREQEGDIGFGNEGRMGAGMSAGTTGWTPRLPAFPPATGPGFLGSVGAGADEGDVLYDENGNPIDPRDMGDFVRMQKGFSQAQEGEGKPVLNPSSPLAQEMEDAAYRRLESTYPGFQEAHLPNRFLKEGDWRDYGDQTNAGVGRQNAGEMQNGPGANINTGPGLQMPGHVANPGEIKPPGPLITTLPGPLTGGHMPGPQVQLPGQTDQGANWNPGLADTVKQKVNEPLGELQKWPKLEESERHPLDPDTFYGAQGGHDVPEVLPWQPQTGNIGQPMEPNDIEEGMRAGGWKDLTRNMPGNRPQGMSPEDWQDISPEMGRSTGDSTDPTAEQLMLLYRKLMNTLGTGQEGESLDARRMRRPGEMGMDRGWLGGMAGPEEGERENPMKLPRMKFEDITPGALGTGQEPPPTMPPSDAPSEPQTPPQGPGGGQPLPQWLLTLLRAHPELQQMLRGGWKPPAGTGQEPPPSPPGVGAPSPGGGPMIPPLDSQDVAGIGHRFGQPMNVGEPQHTGVDLQAPEGTPTKSPVDGFVQRIENNPQGLGVTVVIRGMDQSEHRLGHLKQTTAYPGMQVKMGQDLGSPVGDTGMTTGAHLHWGVRDGQGQPTDPTAALGPMAQMPPVPGTEMMGPPGGVGGSAQQGVAAQLPMGGGQEDDSSSASPYQARRPLPGEGGRRYPQRGVPEQAGWAKLSPEMLMEGLLKRGVLGTGQSGRRDGGTGAWRR